MGFSNVYLVGFDAWTIQPAKTRRWWEIGDGEYFMPTNFATNFLNVLFKEMKIFTISLEGNSCKSYRL